jgi:hypothetical protein
MVAFHKVTPARAAQILIVINSKKLLAGSPQRQAQPRDTPRSARIVGFSDLSGTSLYPFNMFKSERPSLY